jgi:hypothetical protein
MLVTEKGNYLQLQVTTIKIQEVPGTQRQGHR